MGGVTLQDVANMMRLGFKFGMAQDLLFHGYRYNDDASGFLYPAVKYCAELDQTLQLCDH